MPKDATAAQRERAAAFNGRMRVATVPPPTESATKFHFGIAGYCHGLKTMGWAAAAPFETTDKGDAVIPRIGCVTAPLH